MHMDVMSNQGKDDTLEPAYFRNRLRSPGGIQTIVNYMSSIIGIEIPSSIQDDPDAILAWLKSYNEDKGLDLKDLENRINDIETNLLTDDDIGDIVGGLP